MAPTSEQRNFKRQKISHDTPRNDSKVSQQLQEKKRIMKSKRRHVRPRPPRTIRSRRREGGTNAKNITSPAQRQSATASQDTITALSFAKTLIDKIWVRHKNQHRTQPWWKILSMMRKALTRLSALEEEDRILRSRASASNGASSAQDVRQRFEKETGIRRQKEIWTEWTKEVLVPKAYVGFSGVVGDPSFANLGVVLMGILADVMGVVGAPGNEEGSDDAPGGTEIPQRQSRQGQARSVTASSLRMTGLQSGELVERQYDSDDVGEVVERRMNKNDTKPGQLETPETGAAVSEEPSTSETAEVKVTVDDEMTQPAVNSPTGRSVIKEAKDGKTKKRASRVRTRKSKSRSAIDDLFAGLS